MLGSKIGEIVEDLTRVLTAVVPLDGPERIVISRNLGSFSSTMRRARSR